MSKEKRSKLFQAVDYLTEMADNSTEDVEEQREIGKCNEMLIDFLKE